MKELPLIELLDTPEEVVLRSGKVVPVCDWINLQLEEAGPEPVDLVKYYAINDPEKEMFRTPQGAYRQWHLIDQF